MKSDNQVCILGNVGGDPQFRYTQTGQAVADFSVAVTRYKLNEETKQWESAATAWYKITFWGEKAEVVNEEIKKGMRIRVEYHAADLHASPFIGQDGKPAASLQVTARDYQIIVTHKTEGEGQPAQHEEAAPKSENLDD